MKSFLVRQRRFAARWPHTEHSQKKHSKGFVLGMADYTDKVGLSMEMKPSCVSMLLPVLLPPREEAGRMTDVREVLSVLKAGNPQMV